MSHVENLEVKVNVAFKGVKDYDDKSTILLDSGASITIFNNRDLFYNLYNTDKTKIVTGISIGKPLIVYMWGETAFGIAYFCKDVLANIVSLGELEEQGIKVEKEDNVFNVYGKDGKMYDFTRCADNLYRTKLDTDSYNCKVYNFQVKNYDTVSERMKQFDRRQIARAQEARKLQWDMGLISTQDLIEMVKIGKIKNTDITQIDIRNAEYIFGPCVGNLRGKTTNPSPEEIQAPPTAAPQQPQQRMYGDLMFINKLPFLITICEPLGYAMISNLRSKSAKNLIDALKRQIAEYKRRKYTIEVLFADQESALMSSDFRNSSPVLVEECEDAVGTVERLIRVVKERARGIICTLPFKLTDTLIRWLAKYAIGRINMVPKRTSTEFMSPREKLYGRIVDCKKELKHGIFDYVEVFLKSDNTMEARTAPALALMPTGSYDGSWHYYLLETEEIITRKKATKLPMPDYWVKELNMRAKNKGEHQEIEILYRGRYIEDESDAASPEEPNAIEGHDVHQFNQPYLDPNEVEERYVNDEDYLYEQEVLAENPVEPKRYNEEETRQFWEENPEQEAEESQNDRAEGHTYPRGEYSLGPLCGDCDNSLYDIRNNQETNERAQCKNVRFQAQVEVPSEEQVEEPREEQVEEPRQGPYNLRSNTRKSYKDMMKFPGRNLKRYQSYMAKTKAKNMTVKQGIAAHGEKASGAVIGECQSLLDQKSFHAVCANKLTVEQRKRIIPSKLFLKAKYKPDGTFDKIKGRLVSGGNFQKREEFKDLYSPTAATNSVMMRAAIAHRRG